MSDYMQTFHIKNIVEHGPELKSYYFEQTFEAAPGQFINLWIPGLDEKPFSISDIQNGLIEISVKAFGPFTKELMKMKTGEYLGVRGPFGRGFSIQQNSLLIGGGIGIAPLRYLANHLHKRAISFVPLLGAVTASDFIFPKDFTDISKSYFTTDDGTKGRKGLVIDPLREIIVKENIKFIYAAGPEIMFAAIKEILDELYLPYEFCMERYMKCGIGICGQCVLDDNGLRLCVEGPVLNQDDLKGVTEIGLPHRDAAGQRVME